MFVTVSYMLGGMLVTCQLVCLLQLVNVCFLFVTASYMSVLCLLQLVTCLFYVCYS